MRNNKKQLDDLRFKFCCNNCVYYEWYYDKCTKHACKTDARSVCYDYLDVDRKQNRNLEGAGIDVQKFNDRNSL